MSERLTKTYKISDHIEAWVFIPFIMLSLFMGVFAVVGLSMMQNNDPNSLDSLGGFGLWFDLSFVYIILILVMTATWLIRITYQSKKEKEND